MSQAKKFLSTRLIVEKCKYLKELEIAYVIHAAAELMGWKAIFRLQDSTTGDLIEGFDSDIIFADGYVKTHPVSGKRYTDKNSVQVLGYLV